LSFQASSASEQVVGVGPEACGVGPVLPEKDGLHHGDAS
jgi:hypothetical protein